MAVGAPHLLLQTNQDTGTPEVEGKLHGIQNYTTKKVGAQPGATHLSFHEGRRVVSYE